MGRIESRKRAAQTVVDLAIWANVDPAFKLNWGTCRMTATTDYRNPGTCISSPVDRRSAPLSIA